MNPSKKTLCFVVLGLILLNAAASSSLGTEAKDVLIIFSLAPGQPAYDVLLDKIRATLYEGLVDPINLYVEYLDTSRFPDEHHLRRTVDFINEKYAGRPMDLLIAVGPGALPLISRHAGPGFARIPTVFVELQGFLGDTRHGSSQAEETGIIIEFDFKKTLETALTLHPRTTEVFLISGTSPFDVAVRELARTAYREHEGRSKFTYLSGLTMQELVRKASGLPENSIVVYLSYSRDAAGKNYYPADALKQISRASSAPVYGSWDTLIGQGLVGGYVSDFERAGMKAGELALRVLRGELAHALPVVREGLNSYMFDWRQLKRWNISEKRLPPGSIVKFKPPSAWDLYRWYILAAVGFIAVEAVLIFGLLVERARRRQTEEKLRDSAVAWQTTFDSVRDLVMLLDEEFRIVRANDATAAFFDLPLDGILGKHCYTLMHGTPEPFEGCPFSRATETGQHEEAEIHHETTNRWFLVSVDPMLDDRGNMKGVVHTVKDITERKKAEAALQESERVLRQSEQELRRLTGKLISAQENERRRLARELHDDLTQRLAVLAIEVGKMELQDLGPGGSLTPALRNVREQIVRLSEDVHSISRQLHPSIIEDLGLAAAVESECQSFSLREGIPIRYDADGVPEAIPMECAFCLFRILQESLRNVAKHAQATEVRVGVTDHQGILCLRVTDNGVGFDPDARTNKPGLGFSGMKERVRLVRGEISIHSQPGQGTSVEVRVPLGTEDS